MSVPEGWGMTDPLVIAAIKDGEAQLIEEQVPLLLGKLNTLVRLQTLPNKDKKNLL